ncbi:MAG TPA: STAS domain-containing protein [Turneriella sp.]|nr:STAS domain-containing protein [Turneriella sp.]
MSLKNLLELRTETEKVGSQDVNFLTFSGKITSDNIYDLNSKVKTIFENGVYNCVLDISELEYINSTGIALLLTITRTVEQNHGMIFLTKPTSFVQELFEMTDLAGRFTIVDSVNAAREHFKN